MVPSTQYITHQTQGDDDYPSSDETDSDDFQQLRVNVTRPVYTQDQFDVDNEHHSRQHTTLREWAIRKRKRNACSGECLKRNLYKFLPFTKILQSYNLKQDLIKDLIAGLTVGIMHLPQGMAYGMLANLPPVYGLYVSFFPVLVYFLFGTSKHISKGTFAVVSLMVGAVVEKEGLCPSSVPSVQSLGELMCKVGLATATTFIVGVYHLLMGLFKLGFVSIYLSDPLTRGFTTATAVHVLTSQLKHTFGVPVDRFSGPFKIIYWYTDFFRKIALTNVASLIMCVLCMAVIYLTKEYINPRVKAKIRMPVPIELIVIIVSTLMSYLAKFEDKFSMIVVGAIPTGIPAPTVPPVAARFNDVFVDAIGIALVAFAVDLSMGKLLANKHDYHVEANQELRAYGITNLVCSFFNCFVPVASLSRSLVQEAVGGVTQIAGLFSCCLLVLVLLFVGPLFEQLPNNVLSAIVIVNLKGMFLQLLDLRTLWRASKTDMMIWLVVFLSTVLIDVDIGLFVGLGFSLLTVVYRTQAPYTSLLGRVPNTDIYKDISIYNCSREIPGVKIFRFECSLVYANVEYFVKKLYKKTVNPWAIKKMKQKLRNNLNSRSVQNNDDEIPTENQVCDLHSTSRSSDLRILNMILISPFRYYAGIM
ncbi:hypothetical protein CAPTEDRAFT_129630 [Capitella teleta]|uniref:SLC26A/SulP transporter domain-containing protein n=1 Tax=Capitella teleta TaxID=283909 RepID=R7V0H1_CAPTE|nr:hypothetical protein CAPTEDRAFT_129630 [Capitella teleta]|eukprot:ELU09702.1 hypothetical protein CAPTEDRAFT_129630 [Capitella teleta]